MSFYSFYCAKAVDPLTKNFLQAHHSLASIPHIAAFLTQKQGVKSKLHGSYYQVQPDRPQDHIIQHRSSSKYISNLGCESFSVYKGPNCCPL